MERSDPKLRRHQQKFLGYVRLNEDEHYFAGEWPEGSKVVPAGIRQQYASLIAEWLVWRTQTAPKGRSAAQTQGESGHVSRCRARLDHRNRGRRPLPAPRPGVLPRRGRRADERTGYVRESLRPLIHLFGGTADAIDPQSLRALQRLLIEGYVHPKYGRHVAVHG